MWVSTFEIGGAQFRSVTEIAPKSPFLCVNRSPIRYGFRAGAKAIRHGVNKAQHSPKISRLVVPHFSSGIVERAKRERAWKSPHARKGDTRRGERKMIFSRGMIFTRARVSLALLSLRKNGGLLVVYKISKTTTLLFQLCILHDYNVMSNFTPYRQHEHASTNFSSCF